MNRTTSNKCVPHRYPAAAGRQLVLENKMGGIIYLVGLVVIVLAILSFLGLS